MPTARVASRARSPALDRFDPIVLDPIFSINGSMRDRAILASSSAPGDSRRP